MKYPLQEAGFQADPVFLFGIGIIYGKILINDATVERV
jgi:hypothetical protein